MVSDPELDSGLIYIDSEISALPARPRLPARQSHSGGYQNGQANGVARRAGRVAPERDAEINSA